MANLKKEIKNLINRFDAAQEAFSANSTDVKKLTKAHKKSMKALKSELKAARIEIEALKAELAIVKLGAPAKPVSTSKPAAKRRGRPAGSKRTAEKSAPAKPAAKRRGRPAGSKNKKTATKKSTGTKRGPGRPRTKSKAPASPLQAIKGVGPAMAAQFEAAGVKTPAQMAKLSNAKMSAILDKCGPRYRNATPEKMDVYRKAATAAK